MKQVNVGICGVGTVGSGTINVLARNSAEINSRALANLNIAHVGARRDNPSCDLSGYKRSQDIFAVAEDPEVHIVVELIGGVTTAKDLVLKAIENGKHIVTANKALIALHGNEIFAAAEAKGVAVAYEAAVAGGIPIIRALREGLSGNSIKWLAGIINGTGNFILSEMRDKGRRFEDVLHEAQELGYAEADPTYDVEGIDAAHKLMILASIAFGLPLQFDRVFTEGISKISPEDVAFADELGYRIKHLGIARRSHAGIELRVHPTLVPEERLLANVEGVMNAVLIEGDAVGPTLHYGAGAGAEPTASSVVADIVEIARQIDLSADQRTPYLGIQGESMDSALSVVPIEEIESSYYLRMSAEDRPGVLSQVAMILSEADISIKALIQKEAGEGETSVPLILLTDITLEGRIMSAIEQIEALEAITGSVVTIRLEELDG